jgi:Leucine-rich repeat (LRR) protein
VVSARSERLTIGFTCETVDSKREAAVPDYIAQANALVLKTRQIIQALKRGPTEVALFAFAIACFSAATVGLGFEPVKNLLQQRVEAARYVLLAVGAILFVWAVVRIWRQAIPPELPPPEARPAAIKGLMPFTREDGALFRKLGREDELSKLLGYVLDEQIPMIAIMGESGAGKTSLLRAGLSHILSQKSVRYIYWEALPSNPVDRLLHAITATWDVGKDGAPPQTIDEAIKPLSSSSTPTVVVLDQFEQLRPENSAHEKIFQILRYAATAAMPPHRLKWAVAFRRQYDPIWRDFELTIPQFHPPMLSLRMFSEDQAAEIMATLTAAADFTLDNALIADVTRAAANPDGRISAVDVGIGLLVLSGLAIHKNKSHLGMEDYRFAGGAKGILTAYISDRLERFGDTEREGFMKALLALVDLETNQRIAEGKSVSELVPIAQLPAQRLGSFLEYLASPQVRLLETVTADTEDGQKYRLPHERLIPSLRQLTGLILAEADQARLGFEAAFRSWLNSRSKRFLLRGADLRRVLSYRDQIFGSDLQQEHADFLRQSVQHRSRQRILTAALALVIGASSIFMWETYQNVEAKRDLTQWGLPPDLLKYQSQLSDLSVNAPISNFGWLRAKHLDTLSITSSSLRAIEGLPTSLKTLHLSHTLLQNVSGIEKLTGLTTLDLRGNYSHQNLSGIEKLTALTTLDLSFTSIRDLSGIEKLTALTTLSVSGIDLRNLSGIEKLTALTKLDLSDIGLRDLSTEEISSPIDLSGIEKLTGLTELDLSNTGLKDLSGIEKLTALTKLDLGRNPIENLSGIEKLTALTTLHLNHTRLQNLSGIEKLTALTELDLRDTGLKDLSGIEKLTALAKLDLGRNPIEDLSGIEKLTVLTELDLSDTGLKDLSGIEKLTALTKLDLGRNPIEDLSGIEKLTALRTLSVSGVDLGNLSGIEKLDKLESLDLSSCKLTTLKPISGLNHLKTLNLQGTKIRSLKGLPASVTKLILGD